ncbi:hypothetical protein HNP46_006524 [Pseudomonas nitritireducens]|uniref:Uncharacterized protein n=1 Tax=Pseudomonas nitroreducens TaxID=46680 RepID=A0A7W7KRF2_PSENT|nr:hypothetical protein [Pseudomonas nitritireducens]
MLDMRGLILHSLWPMDPTFTGKRSSSGDGHSGLAGIVASLMFSRTHTASIVAIPTYPSS